MRMLSEGESQRAIERTVGCATKTIGKFVGESEAICSEHLDEIMRDLPCRRFESDKLWSYIYAKDRTLDRLKRHNPEVGTLATCTLMCADTRLVPCWAVGRSDEIVEPLMLDLAGRLSGPIESASFVHGVGREVLEVNGRAGSRNVRSGMPRSRSSGALSTTPRSAGQEGAERRPWSMDSRSFANRWWCFCRSFRDHPLCSPTKCIQISFCTRADELSQQFAVRDGPYAHSCSTSPPAQVEQGHCRRLPMDPRSAHPSVAE